MHICGKQSLLFGDPGYQISDPDWKTIEWNGKDLEKAIIWHGSNLPQEFFKYGTPVRKEQPVKA
ncbi:hypothetical protein [Bacillus sp. FJAT-27251]|uniref:hypothetical protein n=1 Tax=Bacillus sp. FJAT-27251 TaxID=1684142 RepID=UPI0006A7A716|nr:hypothetical protein [Bacillus sp. FJAT-27251]